MTVRLYCSGLLLLVSGLIPLSTGCLVLGQVPDQVLKLGAPASAFSRAGRMASAPDGRLFVTDRDRNTVVVLAADGKVLDRIGGPGIEEGLFSDPTDVDPGIGLIISVADALNGRVQRFSNEFRFIESLPIEGQYDAAIERDAPSFRTGATGLQSPPAGRPVALTTSMNDDLYVIDARANVVVRWNRERSRRWIIGGDSAGDGALVEPIDLTTTSNSIFVADAGCACVVVYDLFGTFIRIIADGRIPDVQSIDRTEDGILVVARNRLSEFTSDGVRIRDIEVEPPVMLMGAVRQPGRFALLTEQALYIVYD